MDEHPQFGDYLVARQSGLLRTAWLLTGDWPLAEDLLQTALVKVWPKWKRICASGSPDAYIRKTLITTYASDRRRRWHGEQPVEEMPEPASNDDPMAGADLRDVLRRVLPRLPPRQRAVVVLRYYEDLSEAQTAAALGCSVGTVKSQSSRALAQLRAALSTPPTETVSVEGS